MFGQPEQKPEETKREKGYNVEVERQAAIFAAEVPEFEFSPAEIMSYLLAYRRIPVAAIENCGQWVNDLLREKKEKKVKK